MTKQECFNAPKYAGIYYFKNKINGKYYIGQSVKLRKRLLDHINHYQSNRYPNIALYKAFKKYGLENFELGILNTFTEALSKETKFKLDELEKKYIKQFNSYGSTGYNQTLGGDAGVLGLKHTEETKEKIKEIVTEINSEKYKNPENWVKALNIKTGYSIISINRAILANTLKCNISQISKCIAGKQKTIRSSEGVFIVRKYFDEFPDKRSRLNMPDKRSRLNMYEAPILDLVKSILKENPKITSKEALLKFNVNKNTFMRYRKLLGLVPNQRVDSKVTKEDFIRYSQDHSKEDIMKYFNISEHRYYKYKKKYE